MSAFQISIVKLVAEIFTRPNQESRKNPHAKTEDFDAFLHRIKANNHRMKS
jgi:hypothetical protein